MIATQYIHIPPESSFEQIELTAPFAAVVSIDADVTPEWRAKVSKWLVEEGCLYVLAHGRECSLWDDSVDIANLEAYDWKGIPEGKSVMTTWHEDESLQEVFYFAINSVPLYMVKQQIVVFDISEKSRKIEILEYYKAAEEEYRADDEYFDTSFDISAEVLVGLIGFVGIPIVLVYILINFF